MMEIVGRRDDDDLLAGDNNFDVDDNNGDCDQTGYLPPPISGSLLYLAIVATFLLVKVSIFITIEIVISLLKRCEGVNGLPQGGRYLQ